MTDARFGLSSSHLDGSVGSLGKHFQPWGFELLSIISLDE